MKKSFLLLVLGGLILYAIASFGKASANPLAACRISERARGGLVGITSLVGDPWVHQTMQTYQWHEPTASYREIEPVSLTLSVPAQSIIVSFADNSSFTWDGTTPWDPATVSAAENIVLVSQLLTIPGQFTIRRTNGSIVLITTYVRGASPLKQCLGFTLAPPTI